MKPNLTIKPWCTEAAPLPSVQEKPHVSPGDTNQLLMRLSRQHSFIPLLGVFTCCFLPLTPATFFVCLVDCKSLCALPESCLFNFFLFFLRNTQSLKDNKHLNWKLLVHLQRKNIKSVISRMSCAAAEKLHCCLWQNIFTARCFSAAFTLFWVNTRR